MSPAIVFLALGLLWFGWSISQAVREFRAGYVTRFLPLSTKSLKHYRVAEPARFWRHTLFRALALLFLTALYSFMLVRAL